MNKSTRVCFSSASCFSVSSVEPHKLQDNTARYTIINLSRFLCNIFCNALLCFTTLALPVVKAPFHSLGNTRSAANVSCSSSEHCSVATRYEPPHMYMNCTTSKWILSIKDMGDWRCYSSLAVLQLHVELRFRFLRLWGSLKLQRCQGACKHFKVHSYPTQQHP